jgi:hypothetical protein
LLVGAGHLLTTDNICHKRREQAKHLHIVTGQGTPLVPDIICSDMGPRPLLSLRTSTLSLEAFCAI